MPSQSFEKARFIIQALGVVGVMAAVISVLVAQDAIRKETDWSRKHFTVSTLKDFAGDVKSHKVKVMKRFHYHDKEKRVIINADTARAIYNAEEGTRDFALRCAIIGLLNYAKFLCSAHELHVVDTAFVRKEYTCLFFAYYESFGKEFIKVAHEEYDCPASSLPYAVIDLVMKKWGYCYFELEPNCPNPFNAMTEIKYALPKDCHVKFTIYNILGQKVATLIDRKQKTGYKTARWDASSFSSGIYFYRLQAGDFVQTRKMVVLK